MVVCYLFSFMNPAHEQRTAEILRELLPGVRSVDLERDPAGHPRV